MISDFDTHLDQKNADNESFRISGLGSHLLVCLGKLVSDHPNG